ncbi:MAG TPA: nucleotide sugar dehydrogenase [Actinocrinis sp.]|uniref:nucleotide sugar dehydrogenase n=1 Tax=Actinocrinis sp. TaxID=1920516 RepID=UPI002DDD94BB|nr:nucleotide sugar dehydrogenase [Actinocrinis sp.]HEV2344979.1 nucleotide sugar dehydrogenase [Actinocrinis sp.]
MRICVVALGKIGLPLAVQYASKGHEVVGYDISQRVVELVNDGVAPFPGEAGLDALLKEVVADGRLTATTDGTAAARGAEAIVVVVPLIVDAQDVPDFGPLDAATETIAAGLARGAVVSYETTLPVGTTRERFAPLLEAGSGLIAGTDFGVVFSPERVLTGRVFADLRKYPKLVGGIDAYSTELGIAFYRAVLDFDARTDLARPNGVWDLGTAEAAELAKLAETTYRDVNIGLANTFARFADKAGLDIAKVIEACNSQPYSHIHQPGIAVGGHCIPVYPRMYLWNDPEAQVVRSARETNAAMPAYAVGLLAGAHGELAGQRVAVLGVAYRGAVKETAFSGVFGVVEALRSRGALPLVCDPMYTEDEIRALGFEPYLAGTRVDAAVIQTDHQEYRQLTPADLPGVKTLVDGRRITDPAAWTGVTRRLIGDGTGSASA